MASVALAIVASKMRMGKWGDKTCHLLELVLKNGVRIPERRGGDQASVPGDPQRRRPLAAPTNPSTFSTFSLCDSPELAAYVIWAPKNGGRQKHVNRVLDLVTDARARQYWDGDGSAVDAYDAMFGIEGRPCAGVFMLYAADVVWDDQSPPLPDYYVDAHAREFSRTAGSQYDGGQLAERTREMLSD